jgi:hypothetical protein
MLSARATGATEAVAVRTVASKWLAASALRSLVTRSEAIGPSTRLTDGEFRNRTRGRRLSFPRQRRANERPMYRPFVVFAIVSVAFLPVIVFSAFVAPRHAIVFRRKRGLDFRIVGVFAPERDVINRVDLVDRRRGVFDLEIIGVLVVN